MAYEDMTYEAILARMIGRVEQRYPNLDRREGSLIFDALAPAALELAIAYLELDNARNESFVDTASREYLYRACKQIGIDTEQFEATGGTFKGEFNVEVEIGSRWNCDLYNYNVTEYIGTNASGNYEYKLVSETTGTAPNNQTGDLTPITDAPSGLTVAKITACLIEGENEKTDDQIKDTYYSYVKSNVSDGNVAQYERWCEGYTGIGNYKIIPLWNGNNTVKVSILSASNRAATSTLVSEAQNYFDPVTVKKFSGDGSTKVFTVASSNAPAVVDLVYVGGVLQAKTAYSYGGGKLTFSTAPASGTDNIEVRYGGGLGNGVAPIGAFVTVDTATEVPINMTATLTLKSGYSGTSDIDDALAAYFAKMAYKKSTISYMSVGAIILGVEGVESLSNLNLNGSTNDIALTTYQIPVVGTTTWTVSS